jgi:hypothetical protein
VRWCRLLCRPRATWARKAVRTLRYQAGTTYVPSPVLVGGHLYFTGANGNVLTVLNAATGEPALARERLPDMRQFYASPMFVGGRVYITDRDKVTVVLKPGTRLEVLATNKLDDPVDASPVAVGNQLFLRGRSFFTPLCRVNRSWRLSIHFPLKQDFNPIWARSQKFCNLIQGEKCRPLIARDCPASRGRNFSAQHN